MTEKVAGVLRGAGESIPPPEDLGALVERVLEEAADVLFRVGSPLGPVFVAAGSRGVTCVGRAGGEEAFVRRYRERFGRLLVPAGERERGFAERLSAALAGRRVEVPLDLERMTPFQRRVMRVVRGIPRGEVRPYGWVAREAGSPGASRAVGNVMARNPVPLLVPCHRVVRGDGTPGDYGFSPREKVRLLREEGVPLEELSGSPYTATPTTGVFCHTTCRHARRIRPENRLPFRSPAEALQAGFRPCRACRPAAV
ncbi:methylated-DNA--protein-cysteine methyltransferase [Rubrobacter xylanophilus DSM 9941]|uniref:Methylated-DNA--protein-cysteine methyltransferase n=1 Tax=Rubrobacter xylanophilus (strain DSM 9941 / JCM 11954 / NBRC 16129 / PRD-1) TaxID=266117 RepID=Q1AXL0_RUBXD|nr:methylated-DNA--[protein]-cysteine S-methyltransferase [Rubrobacter xylanophilus]ABG03868.1 methylated-DNA--protein-cysteine methyltransferase [Rubrobacter xylanophilus DSM 9941]